MGKSSKKNVLFIVLAVSILPLVALILALALGLGLKSSKDDNEPSANSRIDCFPEARWGDWHLTEHNCTARGCCYSSIDDALVPDCYLCEREGLGAGYIGGLEVESEEGFSYQLLARKTSKAAAEWIEPSDGMLEVEYWGESIVRFKLYPSVNLPRYEVPRKVLTLTKPPSTPVESRRYLIEVVSHDPFQFRVIRKETGTALFDTTVGGLVLADQFLSISTRLPSENVYGFGENTHPTFRHNLTHTAWPLFARDQPTGGVRNHYGVHPFYTCLENDGKAHGVFLLNSNAMDYSLTPLPMLTYRTIGGVLDFYIILGPTPENVIQQYTEMVGRPYMPPYWSLGFQLCRYGYNSLENLRSAVERTRNASIPLDVQYADIDHYEERRVFTVDSAAFSGLKEYFQSLRDDGLRTVIILDPCYITNVSGYEPFERGLQLDTFVKWSGRDVMPPDDYDVTNSTAMLGYVWPMGKVVFPDFFRSATEDLWAELIQNHHQLVPFDGLWIDMNEPANFGTNEERPWNWPEAARPYWSLHCPTDKLEDPPYTTMATYLYDNEAKGSGRPEGARISDKTLCMTAVQGEGAKDGNSVTGDVYKHYDVHSLYGASQIPSTLRGMRLAQPGERGLVFGRSTFPGSGRLAGHWLGDNTANWQNLRESIIGMLEFNIFGIPYVGADICGFFGDTTDELCRRWMQLGAFYPFARNHNTLDSKKEQDPGSLSELGQKLSRDALLTRYALLPYLYTLFHIAHTVGNTVVRPLHHEFPTDRNTWGLDQQFLWGSSLLIVPILQENQAQLRFYLPEAVWFDYYTNEEKKSSGEWYDVAINESSPISLFVRGGSVLPLQDPAVTTNMSRKNNFHINAYLSSAGRADGALFWDDGVSIDTFEEGKYYWTHFNATQDDFSLSVQHNNVAEVSSLILASVSVTGILHQPEIVYINGTETSDASYNSQSRTLKVEMSGWRMSQNLKIHWRL